MDGDKITDEVNGCTDDKAIRQGYVSITPIHYDLTDRSFLKQTSQWGLEKCESAVKH
jgi:broad specificity polyphosphatase/5'/3'-nucleotidase SurE